jgi:hypothetical protein
MAANIVCLEAVFGPHGTPSRYLFSSLCANYFLIKAMIKAIIIENTTNSTTSFFHNATAKSTEKVGIIRRNSLGQVNKSSGVSM